MLQLGGGADVVEGAVGAVWAAGDANATAVENKQVRDGDPMLRAE
jgi:hypothetical protein